MAMRKAYRRTPHKAGFAKSGQVEADDPAPNRCGCFLPDLTRLATAPSADFLAGIWWNPAGHASSCFDALAFFIDGSRKADDG